MVADKDSVNFLVSEVLVKYVLVGSHKVSLMYLMTFFAPSDKQLLERSSSLDIVCIKSRFLRGPGP